MECVMQTKTFHFVRDNKDVGSVTVVADRIVGAEEDIILLAEDGKAFAVIKPQPSVDSKEISQ
jgi:hypothetical protein